MKKSILLFLFVGFAAVAGAQSIESKLVGRWSTVDMNNSSGEVKSNHAEILQLNEDKSVQLYVYDRAIEERGGVEMDIRFETDLVGSWKVVGNDVQFTFVKEKSNFRVSEVRVNGEINNDVKESIEPYCREVFFKWFDERNKSKTLAGVKFQNDGNALTAADGDETVTLFRQEPKQSITEEEFRKIEKIVALFDDIRDDDEDKLVVREAIKDEPEVAQPIAEKTQPAEEDKVYDNVEEMPSFPGGIGALMKFLSENIMYPVVALENGVQGRVIVGFIVRKDGTIRDAQVLRGIDPSLDREALRVINSMPRWIPGKQGGKAVSVKYNVPVTFRLPESE